MLEITKRANKREGIAICKAYKMAFRFALGVGDVFEQVHSVLVVVVMDYFAGIRNSVRVSTSLFFT